MKRKENVVVSWYTVALQKPLKSGGAKNYQQNAKKHRCNILKPLANKQDAHGFDSHALPPI